MSLFPLPQIYYSKDGTGGYIDGEWVEGTWEENSFNGTIQPMTSKEIESLDVGERILGAVKVYTTTDFKLSNDNGIGDLVLFQNEYYKCIRKSVYSSGLINHKKYEALLYSQGIS